MFYFGESQSRLCPHMRAKFGSGLTVVSKKGSLKFISRRLKRFKKETFLKRGGNQS